MMTGIYQLWNTVEKKGYVGLSWNMHERYFQHIKVALGMSGPLVADAIRKYGPCNFEFKVLCLCDSEYLDDAELYFIIHPPQKSGSDYNCSWVDPLRGIPHRIKVENLILATNHNQPLIKVYTKAVNRLISSIYPDIETWKTARFNYNTFKNRSRIIDRAITADEQAEYIARIEGYRDANSRKNP